MLTDVTAFFDRLFFIFFIIFFIISSVDDQIGKNIEKVLG